ncbi:putative Mce family protein [Mycobacteroides stephanolepidis]|uniref:Putative Mce family protein n=1 Tax=[Mycobacterium] stephanolepidis TaxID=1520670 RepID=A0A1Z4ETC2_9MYCO|nr:MlaD family protein [[Mycobacterium] stephanolepidis]BAX96192.1 putative Mce family protein [[Mycobacterium] stephanolepidis]
MTAKPHLLERSVRLLVDAVRFCATHRAVASCIGLVLTMLIAGSYVLVGGLRFNLVRSTIAVRVQLVESGGLLPNQDVTLRGTSIGRVAAVNFTAGGVEAVATIDADVRIPRSSPVRVSALSPAGEQYLDFRPNGDGGPALTDGSSIDQRQTAIPVSLARLLGDADGALAQLDPDKLAAISDELRVSVRGPEKLQDVFDGGAFLLTTLDSVLPQTVSVIRNSRTVLSTLSEGVPALIDTSKNLQLTLQGVRKMDGGFRTLVDDGGKPIAALDNVINDNSDSMVQLLGNLTTIAQLSYVRVPALQALFPTTRGSMLEAATSVIRDGGIWAVADIYPRYSCDYKLPRHAPSRADAHEPYRYTYCENPDPAVLVRGARNAPRPPGDDTAGPPPGYDRLATTDPIPVGPHTVPLPYGGPQMPVVPPN